MRASMVFRLIVTAVIGVGGLVSPARAEASLFEGCTGYCHTGLTQCPSEEWLQGYCAGKGCNNSLPGCVPLFGNCTGIAIYCNEVE